MMEDPRRTNLLAALRRQSISDERVLQAMADVPRELFVENAFADQAYADQALPISCGQTISQPYVVAFMTESLRVGTNDRVLEIGTGSGYQTAVLSRLCKRVYSVERYRTLSEKAAERLKALKVSNVTQMVGDGTLGWPQLAPYDRIIVTAAAKDVPEALLDQLGPGASWCFRSRNGQGGRTCTASRGRARASPASISCPSVLSRWSKDFRAKARGRSRPL